MPDDPKILLESVKVLIDDCKTNMDLDIIAKVLREEPDIPKDVRHQLVAYGRQRRKELKGCY